ncbi:MAG: hypothetical protein IJ837_03285 [Clostridia bacterium]|nr:hypothetical protein [Clostridia bacterium]
MKLFVVILISLFIILIGYLYFRKTHKKIQFYNDFLSFCEEIETEIGFFQNNIKNILDKQNYKSSFQELLNNFKNKTLQKFLNEQNFLTQNEQTEIFLFFQKLGRANSETEIKEIQNYKEKLKNKINNLTNFEFKKSKLKFNLTICFSMFVFIILL